MRLNFKEIDNLDKRSIELTKKKIIKQELNKIVDGLESILKYYLLGQKYYLSEQAKQDNVTLGHPRRVADSYTEASLYCAILKSSCELIDLNIAGYICGALWHDIIEDTDEFDIEDPKSMENMRSTVETLLHNIAKESRLYLGSPFSYLSMYFLATNFEEKSKVILDTMIKTIDVLTRRDKETYNEYINRIILSKDKEIVRIKICDIMDHLVNFETLKPSLKKRYMKALETLLEFEVIDNE
jgi:hypothetical protein